MIFPGKFELPLCRHFGGVKGTLNKVTSDTSYRMSFKSLREACEERKGPQSAQFIS